MAASSVVYPAFVDIDNDLDLDLFVSIPKDGIFFLENIGSREEPSYASSYDSLTGTGEINSFGLIGKELNNSSIAFVDIDNDGDYDLLSASSTNDIYLSRNEGNKENPVFSLPEINPFGLDIFKTIGSPSLSFGDLDNDGDPDLLITNTVSESFLFKTVSTVSSRADGLYRKGDLITIKVVSETVEAFGSLGRLTDDQSLYYADYISGSGTTDLFFTFDVPPSIEKSNIDYISSDR